KLSALSVVAAFIAFKRKVELGSHKIVSIFISSDELDSCFMDIVINMSGGSADIVTSLHIRLFFLHFDSESANHVFVVTRTRTNRCICIYQSASDGVAALFRRCCPMK